jgi:two-component system, NtrC family, sensor kinase
MVAYELALELPRAHQHVIDRGDKNASMRTSALLLAVVIAIGLVAGLAYWDEVRESRAALDDLAGEQVNLARGVAAAFGARTEGVKRSFIDEAPKGLAAAERQGALKLFLLSPDGATLEASDGSFASSDRVVEGARRGDDIVRLSRPEAADLGLPARSALVGLAPVYRGPLAGWTIAVAATALRERDRELRAQKRLVLSVLTATALLLAFGGAALRNQRKELELQRELAVAAMRAEQNDRLASASRAAALGTLAMGVAHEVSTPLGVIAGRAEQLLAKSRDDDRGATALKAILEQTHRISQVIRGLLGLARGDCLSADHLSAARIAGGAMSLVEHRFSEAGVQLTVQVSDRLPTIIGDARLLESALVNLLLNACDACSRGGDVRLSVDIHDGRVRFTVKDDGTGISIQHAQKALEPFFTTKPSGEGTGLGLAIANEIVKSHLGTLELTPIYPHGTNAVVEIPADPGDPSA